MKKRAFLAPLAVSVGTVFASAGAADASLAKNVVVEPQSDGQLSPKLDSGFVLAPASTTLKKMAMHYSHVSHRSHASHTSHYSSSY